MSLATEFVGWCNGIAPDFHNSPDINNLRFWLKTKKQLQLSETEEKKIISEVRGGTANNPIVEDDLGLDDEIDKEEEEEEGDDMATTRKRNAKGRPAGATLTKELSLDTKQGKIISFIMDLSNSVTDICKSFEIERHALMTQLNVVSRTTGIGYSVTGDDITLTMPAGVSYPFEL